MYAYADFTGKNLLFAGNLSANGTALRVVYGPVVLWHATISQPMQGTGPAIQVESGSTLELKNSILTNHNPANFERWHAEGRL